MQKSVDRFSGRARRYVRYRDAYPPAVVDVLATRCRMTAESTVADIGSGTGALTQMLLDRGCRVYAVEPNAEMRAAAERALGRYGRFTSVDATAEATTLADRSVDLVTVGRAMHWFDGPAALGEWTRILRPEGWAAVIWHRREDPPTTPVLAAYEALLARYCDDYAELVARQRESFALLRRSGFVLTKIPTSRSYTLRQLEGLVLSLSIAPPAGHPSHEPMLVALRNLFREHETNRRVVFDFATSIYHGQPWR